VSSRYARMPGNAPAGKMAGILICCLVALNPGCSKDSGHEEGGAVVVRDDMDRDVRISRAPRRIVILAPSLTETVFALGRGNAVAGVTNLCDYPPETAAAVTVGDMVNPNIEAIAGLSPDLVLLTVEGNTRQTYDKLTQLGIKTFVSNPRSLDGVLETLDKLGRLLGASDKARALTDSLMALRRDVMTSACGRGLSVLLLISVDPVIAAGKGTFLDELIGITGARNAGAVGIGRYPIINREEILRSNPDLILVSGDLAMSADDLLKRFPEWKELSALSSGGLLNVDADVFLRPGPRIFEGLRTLEALLKKRSDVEVSNRPD